MIGNKTVERVIDLIAKYANDNAISPVSYGSYYLSNDTFSPDNDGGR